MPAEDNYNKEWSEWQMEQYRKGVHHSDILKMSPEQVPGHLRGRHQGMILMSEVVREELRRQGSWFPAPNADQPPSK